MLTINRLFDAPALSGPTILALSISPDSRRVTFLRGKDSNKDRLDLWEYDIATGAMRVLVDSDELAPQTVELSDEEKGRRERQRTAALSGIVEYQFSPTGDALLFPLAGALFFYRLGSQGGPRTIETIRTRGFPTDPTISPDATQVAYVRAQNLVIYDLQTRLTRDLTSDGGGVIKNGMAEFVAQEEMDRGTGYWWSPDSRHIAYVRVDESRVTETQRFEIDASNVRTFAQRYPSAGEPNASVRIGVVNTLTGHTVWLDLGPDPDIYVARVHWLPDSRTVAIQRQSRNQRRLDLIFADITTGESRIVISETSTAWIELNHELTFLTKDPAFVWASDRDGFTHLYLYENNGQLRRQLTQGSWVVDDFRNRAIKSVDEERREIHFIATAGGPTQRQLYRVGFDGGAVQPVTTAPGLHAVSMAADSSFFVDSFQCSSQPPRVGIFDRDGQLKVWLLENRLDASHAAAPYLLENAQTEFGTLTAEDGQTLHYRLFKPHDFRPERRYPAIIDVYGGPGAQRVLDSWAGATFTQILTRAGYLVMQLDNRGSAFRGTAFQTPIHRQLGEAEVTDQIQGARWLAAQPFCNPSRIGVYGWSYGGYLTLMLMFKAPGLFHAGISGAPVTDWSLYDTHYTERYLESPLSNAGGYAASSVFAHSQGLAGPLLVMHGMADDNVLLLHSTKLFRHLQDQGKPFEVMVYPGAKHGLLRQSDGRHAYAMMLAFFNRALAAVAATDLPR